MLRCAVAGGGAPAAAGDLAALLPAGPARDAFRAAVVGNPADASAADRGARATVEALNASLGARASVVQLQVRAPQPLAFDARAAAGPRRLAFSLPASPVAAAQRPPINYPSPQNPCAPSKRHAYFKTP